MAIENGRRALGGGGRKEKKSGGVGKGRGDGFSDRNFRKKVEGKVTDYYTQELLERIREILWAPLIRGRSRGGYQGMRPENAEN